jgi:hypothetical protein
MKKLCNGMLVTSVALTMLVGAESAYAEAHRGTLDATNGQRDRGTAIDTQQTGEEGIGGPRVKVRPGDVILAQKLVPDEWIRIGADQRVRARESRVSPEMFSQLRNLRAREVNPTSIMSR